MSADAKSLLAGMRNSDGGFPPVAGAPSEAEPTALAAIALDDMRARHWLESEQRDDGGWITGPEVLRNDSATPLAALALERGSARDRAVDYVMGHRAQPLGNDARFPHDPNTRGWGWTSLTFGWVEPTARGLLALRGLRPAAGPEIADGRTVLTDRECKGGGWNYGNREVLGTDLEPYLQTTAAALMALQEPQDPIVQRGVAVIDRLWSLERGGLGLAMSIVALRLLGQDRPSLVQGLSSLIQETQLLNDGVALGWAALALNGPFQALQISR